jgi:tetratricopeptide (TPR) repeat protein
MVWLARRWSRSIGTWLLLRAGPAGAYGAGLQYLERGRLDAAAEAFGDAQRLWERELGPSHGDVAMAMARRAWCYVRMGRVPEGVQLYERALEVERDRYGPDSDRVRELSSELTRARGLLR